MSETTSNVVSEQPKAAPPAASLPPGLQYFTSLDTVLVKQKKEMMEAVMGFETENKYNVLDKDGKSIFYVEEESDDCERGTCPQLRAFKLHVRESRRIEAARFTRHFKLCTGCCWCGEGCCNMTVNVDSPVGKRLGKVTTGSARSNCNIQIWDNTGKHLFTIWAPCCPCQCACCTDDIVIPITDPSLTERVGQITKVWRGCCAEHLTDADSFKLEFPASMPLEQKILLLGALFFIDFLLFESG